eukprot:TRINITY_DN18_c0_g1_i1.p1 TRINITY_DN18_c0_g1~~TRINITY_DN18_c0_g1_i1.p1  ORF type:complete len:186 (+),score=92.15 TRINITY_DN18_c0_g1_i1:50-607(+)
MPGLPLHHTWNYYFFKGYGADEDKHVRTDKQAYKDRLQKIDHDINTVQDFWVCYLELPKPSEMKQQFEKQGFFLCRSECRPEWEHEEVRNGGFWIITISDNQIDETWKHLLIAAIGQRFSNAEIEDDEVVAIQYETQENGKIRIKVWNKRSEKEAALKKQILEVLKPPLKTDLSYYRKFADAGKF